VIPEDECVDGPGEILRLTFAACDARGTSPLHFAAATVRDCAGVPILPLVMHDGTAVIGPQATLYFDPDPKYVWAEDPFSVSMMTGPVDSLRGFQVYLEYDPTVVEFDSALVGDLLAESAYPLWWYVYEESPSRVRIEGVVLGPHLAVNGPGELVDLYFTAVNWPDTTEIVFSQWRVWDVDTVEFLPVAVDNGLVIVFPGLQGVTPNGQAAGSPAPLALRPADGQPGAAAAFTCEVGGRAADLRADVLDVGGRRVSALTPRLAGATRAWIEWNGRDAAGAAASPGVYFLRVRAGERMAVARIVLVR